MATPITVNNDQIDDHTNPGSGNYTAFTSYAVPAGDDQVMVAITAVEDSTSPPTEWSSATFDGNAMTKLGEYTHTGGVNWLAIWELVAPSGTGDLVLGPSGFMEFGTTILLVLNNVDTSVARVVTAGNEASSATSITTNITPTVADSLLLGATVLGQSNAHTPGTGVTEVRDIADTGSNMQSAVGWKEGGDTTQKSIAWTMSSTNRLAAMAVAFAPAGDIDIAAPADTMSIAGQVPTVAGGGGVVAPSDAMSISAQLPAVAAGASAAVPADALTIAGQVPAVGTGVDLAPPVDALSLTGFAPLVAGGGGVVAPASAMSITTLVPQVLVSSPGTRRQRQIKALISRLRRRRP